MATRVEQLTMQASHYHPASGGLIWTDTELLHKLIVKDILENALYGEEFEQARANVALQYDFDIDEDKFNWDNSPDED